jgi:hypothetical protein
MKCFKCSEDLDLSGFCQKCWDRDHGITARIKPKPIRIIEHKGIKYLIYRCKLCGRDTIKESMVCNRRECIRTNFSPLDLFECGPCGPRKIKRSYVDCDTPEAIADQLRTKEKDDDDIIASLTEDKNEK